MIGEYPKRCGTRWLKQELVKSICFVVDDIRVFSGVNG